MTNKNTKRALLTSVMSLLLCFTMLLGTTYAWFTDSVSSANNIITAGNLDIELYWSTNATDWKKVDTHTNVFGEALWEPGHTEVVYLKVENKGTLALKYNLGVNIVSETGSTNAEGKSFKLSNYILFDTVETETAFADRLAALNAVERAKVISSGYTKANALENTGDYDTVAMIVYMPESVGNVANHATDAVAPQIQLGITLNATQFTYEQDSYGNDYDADALPGCDVIATPDNFFSVLANAEEGDVIGMTAGEYIGKITIPQNNITLVSNSAIVDSLDLNGKNGVVIDGLTFYAIYEQIETSSWDSGNLTKSGYVASITNTTSTPYGANDVVIRNCTFKTFDYSIGWGNYDPAKYCAINFEDVGRKSGVSTNITIENCSFEAPAFNHIRLNYVDGDIVIKDNKFVAPTSHHNINASGNKGNWTITGNAFSNWADGEYAFGTSRDSGSEILNISIVGNSFNKAMSAGEEIPVLSIKSSYTAANSTLFIENNVANGGYATIDAERRADYKYYMVGTGTTVSNRTDFNAAISASGTNVVVNANGANLGNLNYGLNTSTVPAGKTLTIANADFSNNGACYGNKVDGTVIFENCVFNADVYSIHFDGGNGKVIFNNCTLIGWCTFGSVEVEMNNCTIKGNGTYALVRTYKNATLTNCTFDISAANTNDTYAEGIDCGTSTTNTITLIGCTNVNGAIEDICNAAQIASGNIIIQ